MKDAKKTFLYVCTLVITMFLITGTTHEGGCSSSHKTTYNKIGEAPTFYPVHARRRGLIVEGRIPFVGQMLYVKNQPIRVRIVEIIDQAGQSRPFVCKFLPYTDPRLTTQEMARLRSTESRYSAKQLTYYPTKAFMALRKEIFRLRKESENLQTTSE